MPRRARGPKPPPKPSRIEELLGPEEPLVWRTRPRRLAYLLSMLPLLAGIASPIAAVGLPWRALLGDAWGLILLATFVTASICFHRLIGRLAAIRSVEYAASARRLFVRGHDRFFVFGAGVDAALLERIKRVDVSRGWIDRLAGTASIEIVHRDVDGETHRARLAHVPHAEDVAARLREAAGIEAAEAGYREARAK